MVLKDFQPKQLYGSTVNSINQDILGNCSLACVIFSNTKKNKNKLMALYFLFKKWQHKLYFILFLFLVFILWDILLAFSSRKL